MIGLTSFVCFSFLRLAPLTEEPSSTAQEVCLLLGYVGWQEVKAQTPTLEAVPPRQSRGKTPESIAMLFQEKRVESQSFGQRPLLSWKGMWPFTR